MSGERVTLETIRRVYDDDNGAFIEIGPDRDGLDLVEVRTTGKESEEYWGKVRLTLPKAFALKLAEAIRCCAEEAA
jgi:hypothetical protein